METEIPEGGLKAGWKTSEFWLTVFVLTANVSHLLAAWLRHEPVNALEFVPMALAAAGYGHARGTAKGGGA